MYTSRILVIANPFYDRFGCVQEDFLIKEGIKKGTTTPYMDLKIVEEIWNKIQKQQTKESVGGSGANVLKVLSHLGYSCSILGKIGSDETAEKIENHLNTIGVYSFCTKSKEKNGLVSSFVTPDGERTMLTFLGACSSFSASDIKELHFQGIDHMHIEGYMAFSDGTIEKSMAFAKEIQATISIDLASVNVVTTFGHLFKKQLKFADYIFGNALEMQAFTGKISLKEAAETFEEFQVAVATDGANGCYVKPKGEKKATHYPALSVEKIVDTTAAGDFFAGGFLAQALQNKSTDECVRGGNLAAKSIIQVMGGDLPPEQWDSLRIAFFQRV